jgi:hypothetical protein
MEETPQNEFQEVTSPKTSFIKIVLWLLFSVVYLFVLGFLDIAIITPLILPEDYCYYHFHDTPWWVEFFYMNPASNGHPDGSFFHLVFLLSISAILGFFTAKRFNQKGKNKKQVKSD